MQRKYLRSSIRQRNISKPQDMFNNQGAVFSPCRNYRYVLWRIWDDSKPIAMFIGLNPSRADERTDDPTIRRVKNFAASWGYGGFFMLNLFAWITPYPEELEQAADPVGENDRYISEYAKRSAIVMGAWGTFAAAKERCRVVCANLPKIYAIRVNQDGSPMHPLMAPSNLYPREYSLPK